jgi:predicted aspartyl protease
MVKGLVYKNRPIIKLTVANGLEARRVITLVDTGFTGELKLSAKEAMDLNIIPDRLETVRLANGKPARMFAGSAEVSMEGIKNSVEVLISDGMPIIGVGLLKRFGYNLNIDLKKDILLLQK